MFAPKGNVRTLRVLPMYHYFAICDWLVEPSISETNELAAVAHDDIAASDGRQLIVCPGSHTFVTVHVECLLSAPAEDVKGAGRWQDAVTLHLECPSGRIYLDQPTALAIDLENALATGAGTYAVRVAWRGRQASTGHYDDAGRDDEEEFLIQIWPAGPLSPLGRRYLDSDDEDEDEDARPYRHDRVASSGPGREGGNPDRRVP
jgi:hypothetical protein